MQLAALLNDRYTVKVVDAVAGADDVADVRRNRQSRAPKVLRDAARRRPQNDLYGAFSRQSHRRQNDGVRHACHTDAARNDAAYPSLDFVLRGEPILRCAISLDHLEGHQFERPNSVETLFRKHDATYQPTACRRWSMAIPDLSAIKGLVWRRIRRDRGQSRSSASLISTTCRCRCIICCRCSVIGCRSSRVPSRSS